MGTLSGEEKVSSEAVPLVLQLYEIIRQQRSRWLRLIAQYEKSESLAEELLSVATLRLVQRASSGELVIQSDPEAYVRMAIESVCRSHVAREVHRKRLGLYYWHEHVDAEVEDEEAPQWDAVSAEPAPPEVVAHQQGVRLLEEALNVIERRQPRNVELWREVTLEGKSAQDVACAHGVQACVVHKAVYAVNKALRATPQAQAARQCLGME